MQKYEEVGKYHTDIHRGLSILPHAIFETCRTEVSIFFLILSRYRAETLQSHYL